MFGLDQVDVHDNFFELGGHSLLTIRLVDKINRTLDVSLGIAELFQNPTVQGLARVIGDRPVSRAKYPAGVSEVRCGTADRALFCLPGLAGTAFGFRVLSAKMDTSRPILAIELHDLKVAPTRSAQWRPSQRAVVQCMRQVQPVGPYAIVGYSFGGNLAVEVATQLIAAGQALDLTMLLDAHAPGSLSSPKGLRQADHPFADRRTAKFPRNLRIYLLPHSTTVVSKVRASARQRPDVQFAQG